MQGASRGPQKGERAWAPGGQIWPEGGGGVPLVDVRAETKEVASVSLEKQHAPGLILFSAAGQIV